MRLYEIGNDYRNELENIEVNEDGEILNIERLEQLQGLLEDKLEACAVVIKEKNADIEALKLEEQSLKERIQSTKRDVDGLKKYVARTMLSLNMGNVETSKCKLSFRKSTSVEVDEDCIASLPDEYKTVKTEIKADKKALGIALKNGEIIDGVKLVETQNLQIK